MNTADPQEEEEDARAANTAKAAALKHAASAGRRGPLRGARMRGAEHPRKPHRREWGPWACSRWPPPPPPRLRGDRPGRAALQPTGPETPAYLRPGARAEGGHGARATPPPEGADAWDAPARRVSRRSRAGAEPVPPPVPTPRCAPQGLQLPQYRARPGSSGEGARAGRRRGLRQPAGPGPRPPAPGGAPGRGVTRASTATRPPRVALARAAAAGGETHCPRPQGAQAGRPGVNSPLPVLPGCPCPFSLPGPFLSAFWFSPSYICPSPLSHLPPSLPHAPGMTRFFP